MTTPLHSARLLARAGLAAALAAAALAAAPASAGDLTVGAGTPAPTAAGVAPGTSGTISNRFTLTAVTSAVTISAITLTTSGSAVPDRDLSSIALFDVTSVPTTYVGVAVPAGANTFKASSLSLSVAVGTPRTLVAVVNFSQGASLNSAITVNVVGTNITSDAGISSGSNNGVAVTANVAGRVAGNRNLNAPMVSILIPAKNQVVSPRLGTSSFPVKLRIASSAGVVTGVSAVGISTNNGTSFLASPTFTRNKNYDSWNPDLAATTASTFEPTTAASISLPAGCYTLRARATALGQVGESEPVPFCVGAPGKGDGNLLLRENASQLCADCHTVASHDAEAVGTTYGGWGMTCRDCHSPHGGRNRSLVSEIIVPPSVAGTVLAYRNVGFVATTGYVAGNGWDTANQRPSATATFVNGGDRTGPCQVCHSRTRGAGDIPRWQYTGNADTSHYQTAPQACTNCHSHDQGFAASCTSCHGTKGRSTYAAEAPPKDSCGNTKSGPSIVGGTVNRVGAHAKHLQGGTLGAAVSCDQCHTDPPVRAGHPDSTFCSATAANRAAFTWGPIARGAADPTFTTPITATYNPSTGACTVYCHGQFTNGKTTNLPLWNGAAVVCGSCHGTDALNPEPGGTHPTLAANTKCNQCHPKEYNFQKTAGTCTGNSGSCVDLAYHMNGQMDAFCVGCHNLSQTKSAAGGTGTRRPIDPEFALSWSHMRSNNWYAPTRALSDYDCIVCHMEGNPSNGKRSGAHADGWIDLRDPDTGTTIQAVSFTGALGGTSAGSYGSITGYARFKTFSRNLAVTFEADPMFTTLAAIQINQCMKCHDANGATAFGTTLAPMANLPAGVTRSAAIPFGKAISYATPLDPKYGGTTNVPQGTGVTAGGVVGGVINLAAQFATANSSYHPVLGRNNNSYVYGTRAASPWNATITGRTAASGSSNNYGHLMSCWDCHAPNGTGPVTITSTVTAHGGRTTVRGIPVIFGSASTTNKITLCQVCHAGYTGTTNGHNTGSAFSSVNNGMNPNALINGCNYCHSSYWSNTISIGRPVRGMDTHGVNALPGWGQPTAGRWSTNPTPYSFIRNRVALSNHSPKSIAGAAQSPIGCSTPTTKMSGCSNAMGTYTPGGTY